MSRKSAEDLSHVSLSAVYLAGNVTDAEQAEQVLTSRGIDYTLSLEPFVTDSVFGQLLGREHMGLLFWVATVEHEACRTHLERAGLKDTVPLRDPITPERSHGA